MQYRPELVNMTNPPKVGQAELDRIESYNMLLKEKSAGKESTCLAIVNS